MEKHDYNILKALFMLPSNVRFFISKDRDEIFNVGLPEKEELTQRVNELINSGLIYCKDINTNIPYDSNYKISEQDTNTILGLTDLGGSVMEKELGVEWSQYIYEETKSLNTKYEKIFIYSGSLEKIKSILTFFSNNCQDIKILSPWFPVYWKKLPKGYTVSFTATRKYIEDIHNNNVYQNIVHYDFPLKNPYSTTE